jgi:aminobenzoyl-glutamate transport protein
MIALVPVFIAAGVYVTERIIEPRLGEYVPPDDLDTDASHDLTDEERKGLRVAGIVFAIVAIGCALLVVPENAPLRGAAGSYDPFYESIIALMVVLFFLPGLAFGLTTGKITSDKDVAKMMSETMSDMGAYIVLAFAAAHFIAMFNWSNLGSVVAITGANGLESIGFTGLPLLIAFIIVSATINILVGSASAKWAILAPIFVPMLMLLGYSPETTQAAYRIGDAFTNILTPLLPYFPLVIIFAQRYDKDSGIGSIIALMLPYSIAFGIVSTIVLVLWILFSLPLGPGVPLEYVTN